jgi:thiosulfate reductase cytochrome b subunit
VKRLEMRSKHPLAIRWFHWVNFPLLALMIWSGLWIYWANDVYRLSLGSFTLFRFFPEGFYRAFGVGHELAKGMAWHFFFMWFFALNGFAYVAYTILSGEWRYLVPNRQSFREAILVTLHDLGLWKGRLPERKFNGAQQIAYTSVILMGFGSLITGLAIYKPTQFAWLTGLLGGYMAARFEHFVLTLGYVLFFLIHIAQVVRAGWNNFRAMVSGYELVSSAEGTHE